MCLCYTTYAMRTLLYCFFTNDYVKLIPYWIQYTAKRFKYGHADILILTDQPELVPYPGVMVRHVDSLGCRSAELYGKFDKHLAVLDEFKHSYDIYAHLQSNCLLSGVLSEDTFPLAADKVTVFRHSFAPLTEDDSKVDFSIGSAAWTAASGVPYVWSGIFCGPYELLKQAMEHGKKLLEVDKKNEALHCVPWEDETYFNAWVSEHPEHITVVEHQVRVSATLDDLKKTDRIIALLDKRKMGIKSSCTVIPVCPGDGPGLGNVLFLLAACYAHCLRNGYTLQLTYYMCELLQLNHAVAPGTFGLYAHLNISISHTEKTTSYEPIPDSAIGGLCGYFQSSKYFADFKAEIKKLYKNLIEPKRPGVAVVHIRLGDYLDYKKFRSPDVDYLSRALALLSPSIHTLVVLSDDPMPAKNLIDKCPEAKRFDVRVACCNAGRAIRFMTSAQELIMSCSSFSWWGAWLGDHDKVIVDKTWYNNPAMNTEDIYEPDWVRI